MHKEIHTFKDPFGNSIKNAFHIFYKWRDERLGTWGEDKSMATPKP